MVVNLPVFQELLAPLTIWKEFSRYANGSVYRNIRQQQDLPPKFDEIQKNYGKKVHVRAFIKLQKKNKISPTRHLPLAAEIMSCGNCLIRTELLR